ncbi:MAG: NifB/NifX family molybdenum-iron cluster-binding protein [Chloroflexota bacterium]
MKIAISTNTLSPEARLEPRFGRAAAFVFVDTETGERLPQANPAASAAGGAGIQAAELIVRQGADAVISGTFGPNAYEVLEASSATLYCAQSGTIDEVLQRFRNGQLDQFEGGPGRRGHRRRGGR